MYLILQRLHWHLGRSATLYLLLIVPEGASKTHLYFAHFVANGLDVIRLDHQTLLSFFISYFLKKLSLSVFKLNDIRLLQLIIVLILHIGRKFLPFSGQIPWCS